MYNSSRRKFIKDTVKDAVSILLKKADEIFEKDGKLSKLYVSMAWKLVMKYKVKLTSQQKAKFCRKCHVLRVPEKTLKIHFDRRNDFFVLECLNCGKKRKVKAN
ncbi:hypothetical protein HZC08_02330 [Candidatus Micrarchaeota archaeon]|nr:hypothetical protein [Candidatus Micrarchaeota archaeon]